MARTNGTSRIHDTVLDSKILRDTPSRFNHSDTIWKDLHHKAIGSRHHPLRGFNQVRRDVPRVSAIDVSDGFHYRNLPFGEKNKQYFRSILPTYDGSPFVVDLWDWVDALDDYFVEIQPRDELKCKIAAYTLVEDADIWWNELQRQRVLMGKSKVSSWRRMKRLLGRRFTSAKCLMNVQSSVSDGNLGMEGVCSYPEAEITRETPGEQIEIGKGVRQEFMHTNCLIVAPLETQVNTQDVYTEKDDTYGEVNEGTMLEAENCVEKGNDLEECYAEEQSKQEVDVTSAKCSIITSIESNTNEEGGITDSNCMNAVGKDASEHINEPQ